MSDPFVRHKRLCEGIGEDPYLYILELYVRYLQGLFNFLPAGNFHWEPDYEITEIIIRGEAPLNPEVVGKKPAITVVLGATSFAGIGINNTLEYDFATGREVRTDLMSGNLVVYCLAQSDIIAQRLAYIVAHHTRVQQRLLEGEGGFHMIARPNGCQVNSPSPPGSLVAGDPEGLVMVQVNVPFQFQWTWSTEPRQARTQRSIGLITEERRASDYDYASRARLEKVKLAMSTSPVLVRRISGRYALRPKIIEVHPGQDPFQISGIRPFGDEE